MTRINVGINPEELTDKHLIAEHREITRIPNAVKSGRFSMKGQPSEFCLGKGHVKFFYDKLKYLGKRYIMLYLECRRRGFNVTYKIDSFKDIPEEHFNDYIPTERDIHIIKERIKQKLEL